MQMRGSGCRKHSGFHTVVEHADVDASDAAMKVMKDMSLVDVGFGDEHSYGNMLAV